jgi:hypothetical protein
MAVISVPGFAPRRYGGPWIAGTVLSLFLGVMALAAVSAMRLDCHQEHQRYLTNSGGYLAFNQGGRQLMNEQRRVCKLVEGGFELLLPDWAQAIVDRNPSI